jgi:hypothetical protein
MTPDANEMPSESPESGAAWLSVSEASAALGISARATQKRATRGQLKARKVERRGIEVWEIDGRELSANLDANREPNRRELGSHPTPIQARNECEPDANLDANRRELGANRAAEYQAEIQFLRGVVEQLQRDGAETRAALRKALDGQPKQLTSGEQSGAAPGELSEVVRQKSARDAVAPLATATARPAEATAATAISPDVVLPVETVNGAELGEIDDLIYKVFGR